MLLCTPTRRHMHSAMILHLETMALLSVAQGLVLVYFSLSQVSAGDSAQHALFVRFQTLRYQTLAVSWN